MFTFKLFQCRTPYNLTNFFHNTKNAKYHHANVILISSFTSSDSHPSFRLERSVADSTINDADLVSRAFADSSYYAAAAESGGGGLFSVQKNSPKRPSLDERLEKELGIKVRDASELNGIPDFSKPPPG